MKIIFILISIIFSMALNASISKVFNTKTKKFESFEEFKLNAANYQYIVLGEFHNDLVIQKAEAQIINEVGSTFYNSKSVMWEFLNYTDFKLTQDLYNKYLLGQISVEDLIAKTAGNQNITYTEILKASKNINANLFGLNLPREIKQKIIKEGIDSVDPKYIPANHYLGGANYLERFIDSMGGHVPAEKVAPYYLAQCLTDSVMANQIIENKKDLNFIVAGSFHTDFYDGTVEKLNKLTNESVLTTKIVNESKLDTSEINYFLEGDAKYGAFADYLIFSSEN